MQLDSPFSCHGTPIPSNCSLPSPVGLLKVKVVLNFADNLIYSVSSNIATEINELHKPYVLNIYCKLPWEKGRAKMKSWEESLGQGSVLLTPS